MVCLGFEPGPKEGRRSRNHGAVVAANVHMLNLSTFKILSVRFYHSVYEGYFSVFVMKIVLSFIKPNLPRSLNCH